VTVTAKLPRKWCVMDGILKGRMDAGYPEPAQQKAITQPACCLGAGPADSVCR